MAERKTEYFNGQGRLLIAKLTAGAAGAYRWIGNVDNFELTTEVEKQEKKESFSGNRSTDKVIYTGKSLAFSYTLSEFQTQNIALAFQGTIVETPSGNVANEASSGTLLVGNIWALEHMDVSNLVIVDSAATPVGLADGVDYIANTDHGTAEIISTKNLTMPLKATYDYGAQNTVNLLQAAAGEYAYIFESINTAEGNEPWRVQIFRSSLDPAQSFGMIGDDFAELPLEGQALATSKGLASVTRKKAV